MTNSYAYTTSIINPCFINGGWLQQANVNNDILLVLNNNGNQRIALISQLSFKNNSNTKTYNRSPTGSLPTALYVQVQQLTILEIPVNDLDRDF